MAKAIFETRDKQLIPLDDIQHINGRWNEAMKEGYQTLTILYKDGDEILGGEFGELRVTPGDPQDFARRILETLSHPEDARGAAMRLRQVLADRLDWRPVSRGYAQLLREAAAGAKR